MKSYIARNTMVGLLAFSMVLSTASCTNGTNSSSKNAATQSTVSDYSTQPAIKIDVFNSFANYQGIQSGWFGKILKDKFNVTVNIIAPNVAGGGETLFTTRSAAGNLGDIVALDESHMKDSVSAGLLYNMTDLYSKEPDLQHYDKAIKHLNAFIGDESKVYASPMNISLSPIDTPSLDGQNINDGPYLRWDYYKELGYPALNSTTDLLNVLKQMQDAHPKSISGKKVYAISEFKDWDGPYMATTAKYLWMYGHQEVNNTFIFPNADWTQQQLITDTTGAYYQTLKFDYQANKMGIFDPDSSSQGWTQTTNKFKDGAVLYAWCPWDSVDQFNSKDNGNKGIGFALAPVKGMNFVTTGANPYGQWCAGIGSQAKDPQRMAAMLNWFASPEFLAISAAGPKDLMWETKDGKNTQLDYALTANAIDAKVPASFGGGTYNEGGNYIGISIGNTNDIDPNTSERYNVQYWSSYIATHTTALDKDWQAHMGATSQLDFLQKNKLLTVTPTSSYLAPSPSTDIANAHTQVGNIIVQTSWKMIYAKNDAEFDSLWKSMLTEIDGLGYQDVIKAEQVDYDGYAKGVQDTVKNYGPNAK